MINIREKQIEIWKQFLQLQVRVQCKFLPKKFDNLENFIEPMTYSPVIQNTIAVEFANKRFKIIQEAKRSWLKISFHAYELKINEYDHQYQSELSLLKSCLLNSMNMNGESISNQINEYMDYRTRKSKREVYQKMSVYQNILLQNRKRSSSRKNTIGVSSEPYLDVLSNPFDQHQWNHLALGK